MGFRLAKVEWYLFKLQSTVLKGALGYSFNTEFSCEICQKGRVESIGQKQQNKLSFSPSDGVDLLSWMLKTRLATVLFPAWVTSFSLH